MRKVRVKPSKAQSLVGTIGGGIFVIIGFVIVVPTFGLFGIFWTLIAVTIAGYHTFNFFSDKGTSVWEVDVESNTPNDNYGTDFDTKIRKLNQLKEDGLISEEEFQKKRNEIMSKEW